MLEQTTRQNYEYTENRESTDQIYDRSSPQEFDIQQELRQLGELVAASPRVPFLSLTLVDEEQLLAQIESIALNLPEILGQATEVIRQKEAILTEAQNYAQEIILEAQKRYEQAENYVQEVTISAQKRAAQMLNENIMLRQAEAEAAQIRKEIQQECQELKQKNLAEIEQWRQIAIENCQDIQNGADKYADEVLGNLEQQLSQMMNIVRQGREQLNS